MTDQAGRFAMVSVGHRNNDEAEEIVGGLSAGEWVVLHPPDTLTTGARIAERRE